MTSIVPFLGGGFTLKEQIITADTIWQRPPNMAGDDVLLTMIGGGNSGQFSSSAGSCIGGWSGQFVIDLQVNIGALTSVACTIGLGGLGNGSTTSTWNQPGGTTSFGALASVLGGSNTLLRGGVPGGTESNASTNGTDGKDTQLGIGGRIINNGPQRSPGGGGLVLDLNQIQAASSPATSGAQGYGAGGWSYGPSAQVNGRQAGVNGAIRVRWWEAV